MLVWLTEMDLQLTNVEHFSESDVHEKMRQLKVSASFTLTKYHIGFNTDTSTNVKNYF